jgi:ribosomal protein S18 acetylase RimI-like enzyme
MIHSCERSDLEIIMDIGNRAWRPIYKMFRETYGDELFELIVADERTEKGYQIKNHYQQHPEWIFICEQQATVAGFITFWLDAQKKIGTIGNNARDPECNLKGIGQKMYKAVLEYFRSQGMKYATVQTGLDYAHLPARKAYERAGFTICHKDINYYLKL